jgi:hypothetical protein
MMALTGLTDDYTPDGVVLADVIDPMALPPAMLTNYPLLTQLGQVYTQIEAAVGEFGLDTLAASTRGLASNSPGDAAYTTIETALTQLGAARAALVGQMQGVLMGAEFGGQSAGSGTLQGLIGAGNALLAQADALAAG